MIFRPVITIFLLLPAVAYASPRARSLTCQELVLHILNKDKIPENLPPRLRKLIENPLDDENRALAVDPQTGYLRVQYRGHPFARLTFEYDRELDSIRFFSSTGRIPKDALMAVPVFPGFGATKSHAGTVLEAVTIFNSRRQIPLIDLLNKNGRFLVASETVDPMGDGLGDDQLEKYDTPPKAVNWFALNLANVRKAAETRAVVPICRSASCGFVVEAGYTGVFRPEGQVLINPTDPDLERGFRGSIEEMIALNRSKGLEIKWPTFNWVNEIYPRLSFVHGALPLAGVPTLVMYGAPDQQTPVASRAFFKAAVDANNAALGPGKAPTSFYLEFPKADHDLLSTQRNSSGELPAEQTYGAIYKFLNSILAARAIQGSPHTN